MPRPHSRSLLIGHLLLTGVLLTNPLLCRLGAVDASPQLPSARACGGCCARGCAASFESDAGQRESDSPRVPSAPLRECPAGGICQCVSAGAILTDATPNGSRDETPCRFAASDCPPQPRREPLFTAPRWDATIAWGAANRGRGMRCLQASLLC